MENNFGERNREFDIVRRIFYGDNRKTIQIQQTRSDLLNMYGMVLNGGNKIQIVLAINKAGYCERVNYSPIV